MNRFYEFLLFSLIYRLMKVLSSLCSSLLSLTRLSPSGSVIFFPSYSFLNTFIAYCEKTKVMKEFEVIYYFIRDK